MNNDYDIVIGLEIHAELNTKTKIFCGCENKFGQSPNANCCPVCVGMPGALPILNKHAVELTIKAGLTCNCDINDYAIFERKNYFYPDLSKGYQISQLQRPICLNGFIKLDSGKIIRLNRIHLEEDAGKLVHSFNETYVDYNRGGVPLIESVTEPDMSSADEAVEFLKKLRERFIFADVAHCRMEQGGLRCDVNISVKPKNSSKLGTRTEMKNLNSFKSVQRAIDYESKRQIEVLENGGIIDQETRKWDDEKGISLTMRSKEDSQDYRYFPDPDLLTVKIDRAVVSDLKKSMPLLKEDRINKYEDEFGLNIKDVNLLVSTKEVSDFFDSCIELLNKPKEIANWILTELFSKNIDERISISPQNFTKIIQMVIDSKVSRANAKILLEKIMENGGDPVDLAKKLDMYNDINDSDIEDILARILSANEKAVSEYSTNPEKITQFFIGQVMRETKGKANVPFVKKYLEEKLK
ncbi:MAG: Asp-tRNA(Asn)/Glu-tRNA(Gln) amidotransferase subunit GatB [Firmicutes bacterium]|nr:Asp-tRNA(Asn)/Glu-tRNA(Gln) amidotransferase subunit GatB [Bacillota bacterium]